MPGLLSVVLGALVVAFGLGYLGWLPLGRIEGGVEVIETPMAELRKAAGAVGCLTGIVARDRA